MASIVDFFGSKRTSGRSCFNVMGEFGVSGVSLTKASERFLILFEAELEFCFV